MKKIILVFICLFAFLLVGCNETTTKPTKEEYEAIEILHKEVKANLVKSTAKDVAFPSSSKDGYTVTYVSKDTTILTNDGKVTLPSESTFVDVEYTISGPNVSKTYQTSIKVASMTLKNAEEEFINSLPDTITDHVRFKNSYANGAITFDVQSSDPSILDDNGFYTMPNSEEEVTLSYTFATSNDTLEGSVTLKTNQRENDARVQETLDWIDLVGLNDRYLTSETVIPTYCELTGVDIKWNCSGKDIIDENYKVTQFVYERYITMQAQFMVDGEWYYKDYTCKVGALDTSNMTDEQILENFVSTIAVSTYDKMHFNQFNYVYNKDLEIYGYSDLMQSYGFLSFYSEANASIIEMIAPKSDQNRPGTIIPNLAYVTIHDTATSGATAKNEADYVYGGGGGTSWHYTVDDHEIYHQIPDNEVAYHAGDSATRYFQYVDTGIKATAKMPNVKLIDGYYYINGQKTEMQPMTRVWVDDLYNEVTKEMGAYVNIPDTSWRAANAQLPYCGVLCEVGENGNYWMGYTYYNSTYKTVANYGGNGGSIGIETCVNEKHDYPTTCRNLAKLVAELCINNNLTVDRVRGHNYFSGKPCPNAILISGWWANFLDLVSLEKFAKENLQGYTFTWTSNNTSMDDTGKIDKKCKVGTILDYDVVIKKGTKTVYSGNFKTTLS